MVTYFKQNFSNILNNILHIFFKMSASETKQLYSPPKFTSPKSSDAEEENLEQLSALEATSLCCLLEDSIDHFSILSTADNDIEVQVNFDDLKDRAKRYIKNDPVYNIVNGELFITTLQKMKEFKLQTDRLFVEEMLQYIKNELRDNNSYDGLLNFMDMYREHEAEEQQLLSDELNNKLYAQNLKHQIKKKKQECVDELEKVNMNITKLKDDFETMLYDDALKLRYLESWENSRIEQQFMICDKKENDLIDTINKYKNEIEKEIRINSEIEMYIAENQKDIEDGIEDWMQRYDIESEEKQVNIQILKEKREEQRKRYIAMKLIFDEHAWDIKDFLDYKERKRLQEELEATQIAAAIKIQAWWRGTMVRKQLGPFNPNPKKKRKKKK